MYWLAAWGRAKGLAPVNCQMLAGTSPTKRTWMVASSERAWKVRLASESSNRGDASVDASPDASLHLSTPTFPRNLAVWRCFVAATDSPYWAPSSTTHAVRGGHCPPVASPLLRQVMEPAGASALHHLPGELRSPCCLLSYLWSVPFRRTSHWTSRAF